MFSKVSFEIVSHSCLNGGSTLEMAGNCDLVQDAMNVELLALFAQIFRAVALMASALDHNERFQVDEQLRDLRQQSLQILDADA